MQKNIFSYYVDSNSNAIVFIYQDNFLKLSQAGKQQ